MARTMPNRMTAARRLVLRLAQQEEQQLGDHQARRFERLRQAVRAWAIEDELQVEGFQRIVPLGHKKMFHALRKINRIRGHRRSSVRDEKQLAEIMMERGITTRELAARMDGDPLRNLVLLRLLLAGNSTMGNSIADRIANALAGGH